MVQTAPFTRTSIRELSRRINAGELLATTIAHQCIEFRRRYDTDLAAFHLTDDDAFIDAARRADSAVQSGNVGMLCGIPMSVKSVIGVDGYACYGGAVKPLPDKWSHEGQVIRLLRNEGALIAGVTHAAELGVGGLGVNPHWGTPRNPWDKQNHRVPGGSSAGAAVSVWAGACAFAIGTDTGGSVRVPASASGLVGLKVTNDRWPTDGIVPLASRFDTIGVLAHTVDDVRQVMLCAEKLNVSTSDRNHDYEKLSLSDFNVMRGSDLCWQFLENGIDTVIEQAIHELVEAGMRCTDDDGGLLAEAAATRDKGPNTASIECNLLVDREFPELKPLLSTHVREFLESSQGVSEAAYRQRLDSLVEWRSAVSKRLGPRDIILLPTLRCTPPTLLELENRATYIKYSDELLHNTVLPSINGQCAITLPVGLDLCGMPVGVQLVGAAHAENTLLHVAQLIENVLGTGIERMGLPPLITC